MLPLLHTFLDRAVRKGTLEVSTSLGKRFAVGDGSGERIAVWLADSAAARQLLLRPELALGELYMEGRLVVTHGSIYDLIALLACNIWSGSTPRTRASVQQGSYGAAPTASAQHGTTGKT